MSDERDTFGPVIHRYTRAEALEDGTLVAVPDEHRHGAGFTVPVALTATAWADCVAWDEHAEAAKPTATGQDETGRLWDVLTMARLAAQNSAGASRVDFVVLRVPPTGADTRARLSTLSLHIGPGDDGRPVVTILRPGED